MVLRVPAALAAICLLMAGATAAEPSRPPNAMPVPPVVRVCDVLRNPKAFEGNVVAVRGAYDTDFLESAGIEDPSCSPYERLPIGGLRSARAGGQAFAAKTELLRSGRISALFFTAIGEIYLRGGFPDVLISIDEYQDIVTAPRRPSSRRAVAAERSSPVDARSRPLDRIIRFEDPYFCTPGAEFRTLIDGLMRRRPAGRAARAPAIPAPFRGRVGVPRSSRTEGQDRVALPLHGTWRQLPLRSLEVVSWPESEGGFFLVFNASRRRVREAVNSAGFSIPAEGREYRDAGAEGVTVGVTTYQGHGALYCIDG